MMAIVFDDEIAKPVPKSSGTIVFDDGLPARAQDVSSKSAGEFIGNAIGDVADTVEGIGNTAMKVSAIPYQAPMDIYQTGQQMMNGQPFMQTNLGQQASQLAAMPRNIYNRAKEIITHPIESTYQHPVKTALDVGSVIAPLIAPEGSMAEMAAPEASRVGELAAENAMNAIGASKRFINNPMKLAKMQDTAQTLLNEGIIKPLSTAHSIAEKTSKLAETSGQAIGEHLKAINADGNFITPQELKAAVQDLRPVQETTGKILRGGKYDLPNSKIDEAIATIDAHGNNPIPWEEANQLKGTFQDAANWQSNKDVTVLDRMIAGRVRETLDNALERKAAEIGNLPAHEEFLLNKKRYSAAMNAQDPLYNRISSELGNDRVGLTDYILAAGAITQGRIGEALALLGGKKLMRAFGPSTTASALNKLNTTNLNKLGLIPTAVNTAGSLGLINRSDNNQ